MSIINCWGKSKYGDWVFIKCSGEVVLNFNIKKYKTWQKTAASKNLQT